MKYVVLQTSRKINGSNEPLIQEFPIIFPDSLVHADVAASLALHCDVLKDAKPVAAGTVSSMSIGDKGSCEGKSETLGNLLSRGEQDDVLIACYDYLHGIVT